jgi:hypothetical protein
MFDHAAAPWLSLRMPCNDDDDNDDDDEFWTTSSTPPPPRMHAGVAPVRSTSRSTSVTMQIKG